MRTTPTRRALALWLLLPLLMAAPLASRAAAQDDVPAEGEPDTAQVEADEAADAQLLLGAEVYTQSCSACHQPGGVGLAGQFPPLLNNPAVQDTVYMETVIANGLEGEVEVDGVVYDGRMPSQSTLPPEDITAVIAYVQSGFAQPAVEAVVPGTQPGGSDGLPGFADETALLAYAIAIGFGLLVVSPRIIATGDRLSMSWTDAWIKTTVIVVWFVLFTVLIPSWALQSQTVAKLDRNIQDLVGVGLWAGGVSIGLWGLWYAQRTKRV